MERKIKILLTGGHLTPAIAVIEELKKDESWDISFIGRKVSQEGSLIPSKEISEIPNLGVKLYTLPAGKIPRHFSLHSLLAIGRIPLGIGKALWMLKRLNPDIILSFGGYIGATVAVAGSILKIPIVAHEQTATKGLANQLVEKIADKIAISWSQTTSEFKRKTVITGNPIRLTIVQGPGKQVPIKLNKVPLIYITGGNLGSHIINLVVADAINELTKHYTIVHQCGTGKAGQDYAMLTEIKEQLPKTQHDRFLIKNWFTDEEVSWLLRNSDLIISRSGANIVTEIALIGIKAIFIPLHIAGRDEQYKNAKLLETTGIAQIILQKDFNAPILLQTINNMQKKHQQYQKNFSKAKGKVNPNAAKDLVNLVKNVYEEKNKTNN